MRPPAIEAGASDHPLGIVLVLPTPIDSRFQFPPTDPALHKLGSDSRAGELQS